MEGHRPSRYYLFERVRDKNTEKSDELIAKNEKTQAMNEELVYLNDELDLSNTWLKASEEKWCFLFLHERGIVPEG